MPASSFGSCVGSKRAGFELFEIDEFRRFHAGFPSDFHQTRRFKERLRIRDRSPSREMDNLVRVRFVFQNLIRTLARLLADTSGGIEYFFPSRIIGDFMDNQDVLHPLILRVGWDGVTQELIRLSAATPSWQVPWATVSGRLDKSARGSSAILSLAEIPVPPARQ